MNWLLLAQVAGSEAGNSAWQLIKQGGPMVWVLLLVSAVAVTVFLERVLNYRRVQITTTEFIAGFAPTSKTTTTSPCWWRFATPRLGRWRA